MPLALLLLLAALLLAVLGPAEAFVGRPSISSSSGSSPLQQSRSQVVRMSTTEPKPPTVPKVGAPMPEGKGKCFDMIHPPTHQTTA